MATMPPPSAGAGSGRPSRSGIVEAGYARLKHVVIARTGHHYYADKDQLLRDRLDRRLTATGRARIQDYLTLLDDPVAGAAEWLELEAEITIGEDLLLPPCRAVRGVAGRDPAADHHPEPGQPPHADLERRLCRGCRALFSGDPCWSVCWATRSATGRSRSSAAISAIASCHKRATVCSATGTLRGMAEGGPAARLRAHSGPTPLADR